MRHVASWTLLLLGTGCVNPSTDISQGGPSTTPVPSPAAGDLGAGQIASPGLSPSSDPCKAAGGTPVKVNAQVNQAYCYDVSGGLFWSSSHNPADDARAGSSVCVKTPPLDMKVGQTYLGLGGTQTQVYVNAMHPACGYDGRDLSL